MKQDLHSSSGDVDAIYMFAALVLVDHRPMLTSPEKHTVAFDMVLRDANASDIENCPAGTINFPFHTHLFVIQAPKRLADDSR